MSIANEVLTQLDEGLKQADLLKVMRTVEKSSWNGFLADLQRANEVCGTMVTTENLGKAFDRIQKTRIS